MLSCAQASEGNDADAAEAPVPADDALVLGTGPAVGALSAALGGANHASPPAAPAPAPAAPAPAPQVLPGQETTKPAPEVVQPTSVAPAPLPDFDLLGEDLLDTRGGSQLVGHARVRCADCMTSILCCALDPDELCESQQVLIPGTVVDTIPLATCTCVIDNKDAFDASPAYLQGVVLCLSRLALGLTLTSLTCCLSQELLQHQHQQHHQAIARMWTPLMSYLLCQRLPALWPTAYLLL